jgi:hypothetical protein
VAKPAVALQVQRRVPEPESLELGKRNVMLRLTCGLSSEEDKRLLFSPEGRTGALEITSEGARSTVEVHDRHSAAERLTSAAPSVHWKEGLGVGASGRY